MAYVEDACDQCGRIVPRNELHEVSRRVVVGGTTGSVRSYARGGLGFTSGRTDYRMERLRLCSICIEAWIKVQRARKRQVILSTSIALLILAAIVVAILINTRLNGAPVAPTDQAAPTNALNADATALASSNAVGDATSSSDQDVTNKATPVSDAPPSGADAAIPPRPETSPALSKAIAAALDAGATTPWQDGAQAGNVTVGAERFYNGKPCRSFSYSDGAQTTGPLYACDGADGVWRPTADFAVKGLY